MPRKITAIPTMHAPANCDVHVKLTPAQVKALGMIEEVTQRARDLVLREASPRPDSEGISAYTEEEEDELVDLSVAMETWGGCRETWITRCKTHGLGRRAGGRWLISLPRCRAWRAGKPFKRLPA